MNPYYQDDLVTLYHGDALAILPLLAEHSINLLLTDPPYFRVKSDQWDRQWKTVSAFLLWMGEWMDAVKPALEASASMYVFASADLSSEVAQVVADRWNVLNVIRWVKEQGWHNKARVEDLREYLSTWEGIVFAEQRPDVYADEYRSKLSGSFAPIGRYIYDERSRAGISRTQVELGLGRTTDGVHGTGLAYRWEEGSSIPTESDYAQLRKLLNGKGGSYLSRPYADICVEQDSLRRPMKLGKQHPRSDIWQFSTVTGYSGKHPCEKPTSILELMITASSRIEDTVLDPFAGSGSTLVAARNLGRKAIGVEIEERYCEIVARRLDQMCLDFGDAS